MSHMQRIIKDFAILFFPPLCNACSRMLLSGEFCLCSFCAAALPRTGLHLQKENRLAEIFWGRVRIETGTSLYYYHKGGLVQSLIHRLKYSDATEVGLFAGRVLGRLLHRSPLYSGLDLILPVPLHPARLKARGYNQSEWFGRGLSEAMNIPLRCDLLVRETATETQTRKRRFRRWENVASAFAVSDPGEVEHKNILLADDVLTTGSTLEACAGKLLEHPGVRVWVATIAAAL